MTVSAFGGLRAAYYVALTCQERLILRKFFTTIYYKKHSFPYQLLDCFGGTIASKIKRQLSKRNLADLAEERVKTIPAIEVVGKLMTRMGMGLHDLTRQSIVSSWFDREVAARIADCDIFYGYQNTSLNSAMKAKRLGARVVLEEISGFREEVAIIKEEYKKLHLPDYSRVETRTLNRILEKNSRELEVADYVVTSSNFGKRSLMKAGVPDEKILVNPLGVSIRTFHPIERFSKLDGSRTFRLLYVGTLCVRKGLHYLLEAVKQLNLPDTELWLIGILNPELRSMIGRYNEWCSYLGTVPNLELSNYYNAANVFVLPSLYDSMGLVINEAMACGLPVIITENCGAKIRNGVDGFVVPIRDVDALKKKILLLYQDRKLRESMGRNASEYVRNLTWEGYRQRLAKILMDIYVGKSASQTASDPVQCC